MMELWRLIWREGLALQLPTEGLHALQSALLNDDPELIQGTIAVPVIRSVHGRLEKARGACALGYCAWKGRDMETVGEIEEYVLTICNNTHRMLDRQSKTRHFFEFYDDNPREIMRPLLLEEVIRTINQRTQRSWRRYALLVPPLLQQARAEESRAVLELSRIGP